MRSVLSSALMLAAFSACAAPSPCDGVSRELTYAQKQAWAPTIAKQLGFAKVDVLQSFKLGAWNVIYVDTHESDEAFLFYARDPLTSHYVTKWGGAAMQDEELDLKLWISRKAPGIPEKLAGCFAWHVTKDRDL
ncbi:hypothetical protein [Dyella subtropica]|uniref:hypothetical protein n=1 Tax=Dyella subtropica TaxID=2992127 RepID=UPI0022588DB9|nr:hypothetical protein [Dyella subtropica]